jgi:hypothetical protein
MRAGGARRTKQQKGPWLTELVEGDALVVEGRELVPLVRVTSWVRRRASLGDEGIEGQGYGFVHMKPVAILEERDDGELRHQIRNGTASVLGWLAVAALVIPGMAILLIYLWRKLDDERSQGSSA